MKISVKYAVTGALSGAANGFFGAGGGLFLVPLLISWCGMEQKRAFATSVAVIFPLCAVSAVIYWLKGKLHDLSRPLFILCDKFGKSHKL